MVADHCARADRRDHCFGGAARAARRRAARNTAADSQRHHASAGRRDRDRCQHWRLVGAVGGDCGGEELPGLRGAGAARQVAGKKLGGLVGGVVYAVSESLTGDLGQPRVVVAGPVNAVAMKLVGEIGIHVGVRRGGQRDRSRCHRCQSSQLLAQSHCCPSRLIPCIPSGSVVAVSSAAGAREGVPTAAGGAAWVWTRRGHQNQRPSSAAMDGVMKERTTRVSKSSPSMMVEPIWPAMRRSLTSMEPMVKAKTIPAAVTTPPVPPMARMMPVLSPAWISSWNRDTSNRL